jgi:hypothetical protein
MERPVWNISTNGYTTKNGTFFIITTHIEVEIEDAILQVNDDALFVSIQGTNHLLCKGYSIPELMAFAKRYYEIVDDLSYFTDLTEDDLLVNPVDETVCLRKDGHWTEPMSIGFIELEYRSKWSTHAHMLLQAEFKEHNLGASAVVFDMLPNEVFKVYNNSVYTEDEVLPIETERANHYVKAALGAMLHFGWPNDFCYEE